MVNFSKIIGASVLATSSAAKFSTTVSEGHAVKILDDKRVHNWAFFPEQEEAHRGSKTDKTIELKSFFSTHGKLLGVGEKHDLVLTSVRNEPGSSQIFHHFNQMVHGVKVFGGDFMVTTGSHGGVINAHGQPLDSARASHSAVESMTVSGIAAVKAAEAYLTNLAHTTRPIHIKTHETEAMWYNSKALDGELGEVTLVQHIRGHANHPFPAFDIYINARTAEVMDFIDRSNMMSPFTSPVDGEIRVYDESLGDELVFDSTATPTQTYPTSDAEENDLVDATLEVKNFYQSISGGDFITWRGYDSELKITYNLDLANAYFDGYEGIYFGTGFCVDDVIAHEWSHGYTDTVNGLVYRKESGAMNEAISDIFGETIDILNNDIGVDDASILRTEYPTQCEDYYGDAKGTDDTLRWALGEGVCMTPDNCPQDGSLRDMYKPDCFQDPDTIYSEYYYCGRQDNGGVHTNSGVLNRMYSVLVDGGVYADPNSSSDLLAVKGLGLTKMTNLMWRATNMLTSSSQFADMAVALQTACSTSIGGQIFVPDLYSGSTSPAVSGFSISQSDCDQVDLAVRGSGMDQTSCSKFMGNQTAV
jgi:Zn-dependent metalloprotease